MSTPYEARFHVGAQVRISAQANLERFAHEWKLHHPLSSEQLGYAGRVATVKDVGFYHGGDPLYQLEGIPGLWHEPCLGLP